MSVKRFRVRGPLIVLSLLLGAVVLGQWVGQASAQSPGDTVPSISASPLPAHPVAASPAGSPAANGSAANKARRNWGHHKFKPVFTGDPKAAKDLGMKKMREFRRRVEAMRILRAQKRDMEDKQRMEMREQGQTHRPALQPDKGLSSPAPVAAPTPVGVK